MRENAAGLADSWRKRRFHYPVAEIVPNSQPSLP